MISNATRTTKDATHWSTRGRRLVHGKTAAAKRLLAGGKRATEPLSGLENFLYTALNLVSAASVWKPTNSFTHSLKKQKTTHNSTLVSVKTTLIGEDNQCIVTITLPQLIFRVAGVLLQSFGPKGVFVEDATWSINSRSGNHWRAVQYDGGIVHHTKFSKKKHHILHLHY